MEEVVDGVLVGTGNCGTRKRQVTGGKVKQAKIRRYSAPSGSNVYIPCKHSSKTLSCSEVRPRDVKKLRDRLYKVPDKQRQDCIIASLVVTKNVIRRRPNDPSKNKSKSLGSQHAYSAFYFITSDSGGRIPVCKNNFLAITKVGRTRLSNIVKKVYAGEAVEEKRGGDRKSHLSINKKTKVREFISNIKGSESHYSRRKSKRLYLHCALSIRKLHEIYNKNCKENDEKVHFAMFRRIFVNEFNIGFKSPASDVCSACSLLDQKIKKSPPGSTEQVNLMTEKRIHKLRANAFYSFIKERTDESVVSLCFDLQQIQQLPRTNIQDAYYLRQINFYSLCITDLGGQNPTFYTWSEEEGGKGSIEILSALHCHLSKMDLQGKKTLRLFSDGCISQNKNNINLQMLLHFLYTSNSSIENVLLYFPVRGHSFLPADHVFGRVEKILKKNATVVSKEQYYEIYRKVGSVKIVGIDWELFDTKSLSAYFRNLLNISELKRIVLVKDNSAVMVKGFRNYRFEDLSEQIGVKLFKKGVKTANVKTVVLGSLPLSHVISTEKKKDVEKLLKLMYGEEWQNQPDDIFKWYKRIIYDLPSCNEEIEESCDCLDEDIGFKI